MSDDQGKSLPAAQFFVEEGRWEAKGVTCPCCRQLAKVYRRSITSSMARVLVALYKAAPRGDSWVYVPELLRGIEGAASQGGDWAKLAHWDLVEFKDEQRSDGSRRNGLAKITNQGIRFVEGRLSVRKYAFLYNNEMIKMDGPSINIVQALRRPFDYRDIVRPLGADSEPAN